MIDEPKRPSEAELEALDAAIEAYLEGNASLPTAVSAFRAVHAHGTIEFTDEAYVDEDPDRGMRPNLLPPGHHDRLHALRRALAADSP